MKKLHRLIISSFIGPFVATFFISLFLFLMQFLWKYIDELVGKGLEWYVIAELIFYASASLIPMALPLAVLLSSIMTFGNLGERYELVAIKSAGISLTRSFRPLAVVLVFLGGAAFFIGNNLIPVANLKMFALLYDVRQKKPTVNIKEGVFFNDIEGYSIKVGKKDKDNSSIHNILIYETDKNGINYSVMTADHGKMGMSDDKRYMYFTLLNGRRYSEMNDKPDYYKTYPHTMMKFDKQELIFDLTQFKFNRTRESLFKDDFRMQNIRQLNKKEDSLQKVIENKNTFNSNFIRGHLHLFASPAADSLLGGRTVTAAPKDLLKGLDANMKGHVLNQARASTRSINQALTYLAEETNKIQELKARHTIEYHRKFTLAACCILLFFIGAPLGAIIRKGGLGMPLVISVIFFIIYYVINMIGEKMSKELVVPVWQGMWLSSVVLLPIGLFLTYKASTDSALFDIDVYKRFWTRLRGRFSRKKIDA